MELLRRCPFLFFVLCILSSCDNSVIYENNVQIKKSVWDQANPAEFNVMIQDTIAPVNVYLNIRHGGSYQYSNLFLFIKTTLPGGKMLRDTVECTLAAADGKWFGNGLGDMFDIRVLFKRNVIFPRKGAYHFSLEQAMRTNPLPDITDIGIRIEKAGVKVKKKFLLNKKEG